MKKNTMLYSASVILIILYFLSFTKTCLTGGEKIYKTSFIEKQNAELLQSIIFTSEDHKLSLEKNTNGLWVGKVENSVFPAEQKNVINFIQEYKKARNMYTVLDSNGTNLSYFGLSKNNELVITCRMSDNMYKIMHFGNQNYIKTRRYVRFEDLTGVFETENDFDIYLNVNENFWSDPYLVPQNIDGKISADDIQMISAGKNILYAGSSDFAVKTKKLISLRHGTLYYGEIIPDQKLLSIKIEKGNGFEITADIYPYNDDYAVFYHFRNTISGEKYDYNYKVLISSWTFETIKSLLM